MLISIFWPGKIDLRCVFRWMRNVFKYKNIVNMGSDLDCSILWYFEKMMF
jgi:hypothetical protein